MDQNSASAQKIAKEDGFSSREEGIRKRAYELYLARGCAPGGEVQDWLEAEAEIAWKLEH